MTRKHYEMIASRIKDASHLDEVYDLALALAADFKRDNPNFQPERFIAACGFAV